MSTFVKTITMNEQIFPELSSEERKELLSNSADMVLENQLVNIPIDPEHMRSMKNDLIEAVIQREDTAEEKANIMAGYKATIKELTAKIKELKNLIAAGHIERKMTLYGMLSDDQRTINMYDENGALRLTRLSQPNERNKTIPFNKAVGQ